MTGANAFGDRIAQERREMGCRKRRDVAQKDVAKAVGTTGPTVSRWEAGLAMPGDAMIEKLAKYFGVTPAWLRYGQEPKEAPHETRHKPGELMPRHDPKPLGRVGKR